MIILCLRFQTRDKNNNYRSIAMSGSLSFTRSVQYRIYRQNELVRRTHLCYSIFHCIFCIVCKKNRMLKWIRDSSMDTHYATPACFYDKVTLHKKGSNGVYTELPSWNCQTRLLIKLLFLIASFSRSPKSHKTDTAGKSPMTACLWFILGL